MHVYAYNNYIGTFNESHANVHFLNIYLELFYYMIYYTRLLHCSRNSKDGIPLSGGCQCTAVRSARQDLSSCNSGA